jgi:UDP-glucose 4-epimerase
LIGRVVEGVDAVCHLAAHIPGNFEDAVEAERCLRVNGLCTLQLAKSAAARRRRFVYFSANFYRYSPVPVAEDAAVAPEERATYYLSSKFVGENFVEHLRRAAGLSAVSLRVGNVYGPGMPERSVVARFLAAGRAGEALQVWDGGIATYDYVHAADVAAVALAALERGEPGVYNIGGGRACSLLQLADAVADLFPERPRIVVLPPGGTAASGFPAMDIGKAARAWRYAPRPLSEGLRSYLRELEATPE